MAGVVKNYRAAAAHIVFGILPSGNGFGVRKPREAMGITSPTLWQKLRLWHKIYGVKEREGKSDESTESRSRAAAPPQVNHPVAENALIPMRDGTLLAADIHQPRGGKWAAAGAAATDAL